MVQRCSEDSHCSQERFPVSPHTHDGNSMKWTFWFCIPPYSLPSSVHCSCGLWAVRWKVFLCDEPEVQTQEVSCCHSKWLEWLARLCCVYKCIVRNWSLTWEMISWFFCETSTQRPKSPEDANESLAMISHRVIACEFGRHKCTAILSHGQYKLQKEETSKRSSNFACIESGDVGRHKPRDWFPPHVGSCIWTCGGQKGKGTGCICHEQKSA